ncbi:DUF368 domain-containing protein [Paenibacillus septentrionalis]|uniref:DUF368 domain-containing protein n=1 Tax=Paenibacillus septentrionalis TaxID=429342 RepID=A0ABW1V0Y6_9BACL
MLNWKQMLKGMLMGTVETVPGVSSSTIAMLMGIYEKLIESIGQLTSKRWKEGVAYLIPIGIGMVGGFLVSVLLISYLLENFQQFTHFLFMGLVIGILPSLWNTSRQKENGTYKWTHFIAMAIAFAVVAATRFFDDKGTAIMTDLSVLDYVFLFFSGWLASTALVLPGISGALVLTILGVYYTAISAISSLDIPIILTLGAGIVVGVLITSKLIRFLMSTYTMLMYALMIGLIAGSNVVLYPGLQGGILNGFICLIAVAAGFIIAYYGGRISRQSNTKSEDSSSIAKVS